MSLQACAHCLEHTLGSQLLPLLECDYISDKVEMTKEMIMGC